jgi:hypothetical protein
MTHRGFDFLLRNFCVTKLVNCERSRHKPFVVRLSNYERQTLCSCYNSLARLLKEPPYAFADCPETLSKGALDRFRVNELFKSFKTFKQFKSLKSEFSDLRSF